MKLQLIAGLFLSATCFAQNHPFQNLNLISEERTKDLITRLTIEEKASLLFFDSGTGKMTVQPGEYEVWYGNSSATKDLKMVKISIQ